MVRIQSLTFFPVKSCRWASATRLLLDAKGPLFDREWMLVGGDGKFVTQRELPALALLQPHLHLAEGFLRLTAPGMKRGLELSLQNSDSPKIDVEIFGQLVTATQEGAAASTWLAEATGQPLRLVRVTRDGRERTGEDPRTVRFSDSYPLHLTSLASLNDLNQRLPEPIPMDRFRANVVIEGASPWEEDSWTEVKLGGSRYRVGKRAERCSITTVDQTSGRRGSEPLKTLSGFRRNARGKVEFGQYLHSVPGAMLEVGMEVSVD